MILLSRMISKLKKGFLLTPLLLSVFSCQSVKKEKGCGQFRTGSFELHFANYSKSHPYLISRIDSAQTEIDRATGNLVHLSVHWTSDCTYQLLLLSTTEKISDSERFVRTTYPMNVEITKYTDNYYLYKAKRVTSNRYIEDTMWVRANGN